jgi:hypothetical protein
MSRQYLIALPTSGIPVADVKLRQVWSELSSLW